MDLGPWGFKSPLAHSVFSLQDVYLEEALKVDVKTLEPTKKRINVEIPSETVNEELLKIYETIRKEAKIPGFRPGRAPIRLIKARFKDHVRQEALQALLPQAYEDIFEEQELAPLSMPELETDIEEMVVEEDQPLAFTFTVEVRPEVTLPPYSEIEIDKRAVNVPREAVDDVAKRLQEERAEYPAIEERETQLGDYVTVDWTVTEGDETLDEREDFRLKLEEGNLIPELEQALIGVMVGSEQSVSVTFPEDNADTKVAGKSVVFHVKVKEINKQVLPELDDAFAADLGHDTYEQFVGSTWNRLIEAEKQNKRQQQIAEILTQLREKVAITIPDSYIEEQTERLKENYRRAFQREGRALSDLESDDFWEGLRDESITNIHNTWILAEVVAQEDFTVEDWEVDREIRGIAEQRNQEPDTYRQMLETTGRLEQLNDSILEAKMFDFLIENASAKEPLIVTV